MLSFFSAHSFVIAQILGFIAMGMATVTYQFKSRRVIMFLIAATSAVWCLHFIVLGKYAGCAMNVLSIFRSFIFGLKEKYKWAGNKAIPWVFEIISVAACLLTWEGILSLLPLIGTVVTIPAHWQSNTKRLKLLSIPNSVCWFVYDLLGKSIAGSINEILVLGSIAVYFIRDKKQTKA